MILTAVITPMFRTRTSQKCSHSWVTCAAVYVYSGGVDNGTTLSGGADVVYAGGSLPLLGDPDALLV